MTARPTIRPTARLPDWEARLSDYIAGLNGAGFDYGRLDCALFFAGGVVACRGDDPAAEFRGKYRTKAGSIRALRTIGAGDLESTLDAKFEQKPVAFLQRGDGVWDGEAVGVCMGPFALFIGTSESVDGLYRVPRSDWLKGWAV